MSCTCAAHDSRIDSSLPLPGNPSRFTVMLQHVFVCGNQVLACLVFTSLGVTALLLGRRSGSAIDRGLAGLVAAGCMLPCRMLLPRLYKAANAPPRDQKRGALRSLLKGGVAKIALDQPPAGSMMPCTLMRGRSWRCNQSNPYLVLKDTLCSELME